MAQKTNPNLLRLGITSTWLGSWSVSKKYLASTFTKYLKVVHLTRSFYQTRGFHINQYYIEQLGIEKTIFHLNLREFEGYEGQPKSVGFYPRYSSTLPKTVPAQKRASLSAYADFCLKREAFDSTYVVAKTEDEFYEDLNIRLRHTVCEERQILLPLLKTVSGSDFLLVKSSPSYRENFKPTAELLAITVREQLLNALKRGKNVTAMRYFRNVGLFLQATLGQNEVRGVRFQIKGRLPKSGGSSGAARSKHQLVSIGYLSNQKITAPLDYSAVGFRTRSGLCSIKVWASYQSPIRSSSELDSVKKDLKLHKDFITERTNSDEDKKFLNFYWNNY
jgi:hypothetical protein